MPNTETPPRSTFGSGELANAKRWHGSIDDQYTNIDNVVVAATENPGWGMPTDMLTKLTERRDTLRALISKCRNSTASQDDRADRNFLLKATVGYCVTQVKVWALGLYMADVITLRQLNSLGFLAPGQTAGYRGHSEATRIKAEVKVKILGADLIRVIVDQSSEEDAAHVVRGWPHGVRQVLIVILAADGTTEVLRKMSSHLFNDIRMPDGSRGKQFIIKAAFLKHLDDEPNFGDQPTFSMPLQTEDLVAALDRQHHEDFEEHLREVEAHRQEVERLETALKAAKSNG
jgi:hypothetical protein